MGLKLMGEVRLGFQIGSYLSALLVEAGKVDKITEGDAKGQRYCANHKKVG